MSENKTTCPVCDSEMSSLDVPGKGLFHCHKCNEVGQLLAGGVVSPINLLLEKNYLGDDRVRAAISRDHVSSLESFVEKYDSATHYFQADMAKSVAELRVLLVQVENRINVGISKLTELAVVDESAAEGVAALTEAREMVSTSRRSTRGVPDISKQVTSAEG